MKSDRWPYLIAIMAAAASYGVLSAFIKLVYREGFQAEQVTLAQVVLGTLLLWIVVALNPRAWVNPFRGPWVKLGLLGIFGLLMTTLCYNIALSEMDASMCIVLLFQFTWMTMAMDCIANRRRPGRKQLLAVAVIVGGTLLAADLFSADWTRFSAKGLLFGLLSALSYSVFMFFAGRTGTDMNLFMKSAFMQTATLPALFVLYPPAQYLAAADWVPLALWGLLIGKLGTMVPTVLFTVGIPKVGSSLAAMIGAIELPVAIVAALLFVGEQVMAVQWFGMALILSGIIIVEAGSRE